MSSIEIKEKILDILKDNTIELSSTEIQKKLKHNRTTITKYLNILLSERKIKFKRLGMAKIWSISDAPILSFFSEETILSDKDNYLKEIFNLIEDTGIALLDKKCNFIWINDTLSSWIGNIENIKGKSCCSIHEINETNECPAKKTLKTGKYITQELKIKLQTNRTQNVEISSTPIKDKNDNIIGILQTIKDTTERIKIQEKLKEYTTKLEEKVDERTKKLATLSSISYTTTHLTDIKDILQGVLNDVLHMMHISVGMIFIKDTHEKLILNTHHGVTKTFQDEFTKTPLSIGEGIIGSIAKTREPILLEDHSSKHAQVSRMAAKNEELRSFIGVPIKTKQNILGVLCVASKSTYTFNASDKDIMIAIGEQVGFVVENTELFKKTKESKEKYKGLLKASPDAVALINIDGKLIEVSEIFIKMLGISNSSKQINRSIYDFIDNKEKVNIKKNIQLAFKTGAVYDAQYLMNRVDKSKFYAEINSVLYKDSKGNSKGILTTIRDISKRKRIETKLLDSEKRYRTIIENSNDMIWTLDTNANFLYFNKHSEELSGYTFKELQGKSFAPLLDPNDLPHIQDIFKKTISGTPQQYKVSVTSKNKTKFLLSVTSTPLYSENTIIGTVSFGRDITTLNKKEKEIKDTKNYLEAIITTSKDGIFVIDKNGNFEFGNDAFYNIIGWSKKELLGKSFLKVIPKEYHKFILKRWEEVQNKKGTPYETKILTKNEGLRHITVSHTHTKLNGERKYIVVIHDITQQKITELKLNKSHEFLQKIINTIDNPILVIKPDKTISLMNDAAARNSSKINIKNKNSLKCFNISHNSDKPCSTKNHPCPLQEVKKTKKTVKLIHNHINENGEKRIIEITASPLFGKNKEFLGIIESNQDITKRIHTENKIKKSEEKYRNIVELSTDTIYTSNAKGDFTFINNAGYKLLEATPKDIINKPWINWLHPEDKTKSLEKFNEIIKKEIDVFNYENRFVSKSGKIYYMNHNIRVLKDTNNNIIGTQGIARNITLKKKSEKELIETKNYFETIIQMSSEGIFVVDDKGNFEYGNQACTKICGWSSEELIRQPFIKLIPKEHQKAILEKWVEAQNNKAQPYETTIITKSGEHKQLSVSHQAIDFNDQKKYINIIRDITKK